MAEWLVILVLVLLGIVLIIIEILFIPGTTKFGIAGILAFGAGIFYAFKYFGSQVGYLVLVFSILFTIGAIVYALRSNTWTRFSLKTTNEGKFNEGLTANLKIGDRGKTLSFLRPVGKAEFSGGVFEVTTTGSYVESGQTIEIIGIKSTKIIVKSI